MAFSKPDEVESIIMEQVYHWCDENIDFLLDDASDHPRKRKRVRPPKIDYSETNWGRILNNPNVRNEDSREAKIFRLRFRCPFAMFVDFLMPFVVEKKIFPSKCPEYARVPVEIKVLIALRILARGNVFDDVAEMSAVAKSTVVDIFKQFVRGFSKHRDMFIKFHTEQRLQASMNVYSNLGFPGAFGSMDATHVRLWKCPEFAKNLCEGKEGYYTWLDVCC
jgi:hypothetical protein